MSDVIERISAIGIVPVISKLTSFEDCDHLAKALTKGGLPLMEITFRMEKAEEYIHYVKENCPEILVGAGTVLTVEQAEKAIAAGASFVVAPGLNPDIVTFCQSRGIEVVPGISSATEIERAMGLGLKNLKFFPCEACGGPAAIKALCGPYKGIGFMPTGGVNLNNLTSYLALDRVIAVGGSFMLGSHLAAKEWDQVTELCRKSVQTMLGLKLIHIGINMQDEAAADEAASELTDLLKFDRTKDGNSSIFVDSCLEVMKSEYLGSKGHIAFSTPYLDRAVHYFKAMGHAFNEESAKYGPDGKLKVIYFEKEIGGFAIHLAKA